MRPNNSGAASLLAVLLAAAAGMVLLAPSSPLLLHAAASLATDDPLRINVGSTSASTVDGVDWQPDEYYSGGEIHSISTPPNTPPLSAVESTLRSFPSSSGSSCYDIPLSNGRYLVRSGFVYRNYDGQDSPPVFNVKINGLLARTVVMGDFKSLTDTGAYYLESLVYALEGAISICFLPFKGINKGPPFVSSIEIIPSDTKSYDADLIGEDAILTLHSRVNLGGPTVGPEPVDPGYRVWAADVAPSDWATDGVKGGASYTAISTSQVVSGTARAPDYLPYEIFQTARKAPESTGTTVVGGVVQATNPLQIFYARLYFAEIEAEVVPGDRVFDILLGAHSIFGGDSTSEDAGGKDFEGFEILKQANGTALSPVIVPVFFNYSVYLEEYGKAVTFSLVRMAGSKKPPIISAYELYEITRTPESGYLHRGLTSSDIALIVIFCLVGVAITSVLLAFIASRVNRNNRRFAIYGAEGKLNE